MAIWTHRNNSPNFGYIGQLWKYLQVNINKLDKAILVGDFNSNAIWDDWDRWWNHTDVFRQLEEKGIRSLYHKYFGEQQGKETQPTFFLQRKLEKSYHIDYCLASQEFIKKFKKVSVGKFEDWKHLSDHVPLTVEFNIEKDNRS